MKKIFNLILVLCLVLSGNSYADKSGEISSSNNEFVIFKHSQFVGGDTHRYWKENIPNTVINYCKSKNKNTYKFYGDDFHSGGAVSILLPVGSAFYRYICAEDLDDAIKIRSNIIKIKNEFNKGALHWKEKSPSLFYSNRPQLKYEWFVSDRIKQQEAEQKKIYLRREAEFRKKQEEERKLELLKQAELRKKIEEEKKEKLAKLENEYGSKCSGILSLFKYEKGTPDYEKCLFSESAKDFERKELARKEKERIEKQQKEQILIAQQKEIIKISKFTPEEKRAYDCEKTFGFKKGSGDFKDCIFKLYTISAELEKEELRVQIKKLEMANERQKQIIAQNKVNQQVYINENANQNAIADAMREANSIARGKALLEYSRTLNNRNRGTNCMITRHGIHSILNCR